MTQDGPRSFGKYLLDREIARGGMARVHLATLRGLGGFEKRLVVKEILPELASDPKFVSMFVEEAKVLVALSHPNIVPVYELGIVDGTYFLAMEHVEGATLADIVAEGTLTPAEAARVGAEIADALAYAHERFDIVHRDVSPRNVMVDTAGHARLLDFGIAARADDGEGDALYGTPGFLSPEQARGEKLGPASDLFSLGCVLAYATTGASPIGGKELDRLRALDAAPAVAIEGAPALERIVRELLAPSPAARPAAARSVARTLAAAASALEHVDESASATLARRASQKRAEPAEPVSSSGPGTEPVTPGRVETLAKSQALDAILGTAKVARAVKSGPVSAPVGDEADAPRTARIERSTPGMVSAPVAPAPSRTPAILFSIAAALVAGLLVWNARFELGPTEPIDPIDRGLESPADIEPLAIEDAELADAGGPEADAVSASDAGVPSAHDANVGPRAERPDTGAPRGTATLVIRVTPWADVRLDGRPIGRAGPRLRATIPAGPHTVSLDCPALGREHDVQTAFRAEPGDDLAIDADLDATPPTIRGP